MIFDAITLIMKSMYNEYNMVFSIKHDEIMT